MLFIIYKHESGHYDGDDGCLSFIVYKHESAVCCLLYTNMRVDTIVVMKEIVKNHTKGSGDSETERTGMNTHTHTHTHTHMWDE